LPHPQEALGRGSRAGPTLLMDLTWLEPARMRSIVDDLFFLPLVRAHQE
jgi:hypothetical protein